MKLATLTSGQQRLLTRFSEAGGVVEFVFLDCDEFPPRESSHRAAVLHALREIQRRTDEYAERMARVWKTRKSRFFQVHIDETAVEKFAPRQITWKQFLGGRFDFERGGLIVHGKGDYPNDFFYFRDRPIRENIIPSAEVDSGIGTGLAYAFSSPPHPLRLSAEERGEAFDKFLRFLICGSDDSLIYEWPTDWSNFFDDGNEWWGSFLWSLSNPESDRITVIAASTTD